MDPDLQLKGIILNRIAGDRHEAIVREAIGEATGLPVIGSVRRHSRINFPQRHLGLVPLQEHPLACEFVQDAASLTELSVDLDALIRIAEDAGEFPAPDLDDFARVSVVREPPRLRIGIVKDSAFQFYYPENLEALSEGPAELVFINALEDTVLPDLDGLYIGGGFPETHAEQLAANHLFKVSLRKAVEQGLPVYAECGGLMYLSRSLRMDDKVYPMVGVFPIDTVLERKPQGLGYIQVSVERPNPFYPEGTRLAGHEFHYSSVAGMDDCSCCCAFRVLRGHGMDGAHDGFCRFNALGTYVHVHALGEPLWARGILDRARQYRQTRHRAL